MVENFNKFLVSYNSVKAPTFGVPTIPSYEEYYPVTSRSPKPSTREIPQRFTWTYNSSSQTTPRNAGNAGSVKYNGQTRTVNEVVSTLRNNAAKLNYRQTGRGKHTCTRAVVHALTGQTNYDIPSGVANPGVLYNRLSQQGWTDVLNDSYTPQAGDVYTVWGLGGQYGMHSSMYDGTNWGSYTSEGSTPYYWTKRNNPGAQVHVMRYINNSKKGGIIWHH